MRPGKGWVILFGNAKRSGGIMELWMFFPLIITPALRDFKGWLLPLLIFETIAKYLHKEEASWEKEYWL
jgi:hypothetical protein